ncbi:MAG: sodium:solute symporter, partial [Bacteroidales bacterium]|nr:sodium:solute symporter [Bacteroidales bacterium]
GMDVDPVAMTRIGEGAYVNMSKAVLMSGMLGMMLAAMLSATMSNFSGNLNVYANVFTYEIWGGNGRHKDADERTRIKVGRIFTLVFGLCIIAVAMLIPFAGGAEKMVVTILTMVLCPLYIPSLWGLFSRRLTGNQLIYAMLITWIIGFTAKFAIPAEILSQSLIESISGCILPLLLLGGMEIWSAKKGLECKGYDAVAEYTDPNADVEPSLEMKKAVRKFSRTAINCFCITIGFIAALLLGLVAANDAKTLEVKGIVLAFAGSIVVLIAAYFIIINISGRPKKNN